MSTVKFELNDKNEIISYVKQGGIVGIDLVEFDESNLPDGFYENYKPHFYLLKNNEIVENPNYVAPEPQTDSPSNLEKRVAAISYQQMADSQTISTLQKQDAQMAYQIMTGGN